MEVKTSRRDQERIDLIQPYTPEGKINRKFIQFYGKAKFKKFRELNVGTKLHEQVKQEWEEQNDIVKYQSNKDSNKKFHFVKNNGSNKRTDK